MADLKVRPLRGLTEARERHADSMARRFPVEPEQTVADTEHGYLPADPEPHGGEDPANIYIAVRERADDGDLSVRILGAFSSEDNGRKACQDYDNNRATLWQRALPWLDGQLSAHSQATDATYWVLPTAIDEPGTLWTERD